MHQKAKRRRWVAVMVAATATAGVASPWGTTAAAGQLELRYVAAAGEANDLTLVEVEGGVVITDTGAAVVPNSLRGCTPVAVPVGVAAACEAAGTVRVVIDLGDGDDHVLADMLTPRFTLHVHGGDGDDIVEPGDGDDRIVGGPGSDTLYGGYGADEVLGQGGDDNVNGSPGADVVDGGAGFDFIFGGPGSDLLIGGGDLDYMYGAGGDDVIDAGPGTDLLDGGGGDDTLLGGVGDDELDAGRGIDTLDGGGGDDLLRSRDDEPDTLRCGAGVDVARIDGLDLDRVHPTCERVRTDLA